MTTATSLPGQCLGHSPAGAELWATSSCSAQHYQAREYPHHQVQPDASMFEAWALRQVETQLQPVAAAQLPSELNAGVYKTDEFRMYSFKVRRCPKGPAHDWTDCPYCHPGEKAKRRDPRKYAYTGIACPDFRKASCKRGDACPYAHGVFECWLHPSRYRTQLCKDGTACTRSVCFFAHTLQELRTSSLSVSLSQDWKPKTFGTSPPSPTAPPLLSSEEGSPRSLGAKACHTEAELLQSLIPSPGSSYAGYSHLQPQPSTCSTSSLYSQAADTQSLLAPQSQLHQQMPQHVLAQQMQQHQQQLPHQLPQSQAQLQMEQAMRLLSIGSGNGYEGARQRAPSAQPALEHLAPATQAMLHAPAHRRPSHPKTLHQASPPPMRIPSPAFPSASSQYLAGRASNSPAATGGTMDHQWLEYLQASGHLSGHGLKSPPMRVPDARWMDYAVLNQSLPQPTTSNGFPQHFVPRPEACVSW